ncbi:hypothetical protein [Streptomyces sp. NPDC054865]
MKTTFKGQRPQAETDPESGWRHLLEVPGGVRHTASGSDRTQRRLMEIARSYDRVLARAQGKLHPEATDTDVLAALHVVRMLREKLDADELALTGLARTMKITWARIAVAQGVRSRQSAERRYLQLSKARPGATQNERVEATREQRRRRAELDWALDHAPAIHALALSLAAVPNLQERADDSREARLMAALRVPISATATPPSAEVDQQGRPMSWPPHLRECLAEYERFLAAPEDYLTAEQRDLGDTQWQIRRAEAEIAHRLLGLVRTAAQGRDIDLSDHPELLVTIRELSADFREAIGRRRR